MTSDADPRTPMDDVIDEIGRGMTPVTTPDVRARVFAQLEKPAAGVRWWRPAALAAALMVAAVLWWPAPDVQPPRASQEPVERPVSIPELHDLGPPRVRVRAPAAAVPARRRPAAPHTMMAWPDSIPVLPAIDIAPMENDALAIETTHSIETVDMPAVAIEPLDVAPLPRSSP